MASNRANYRKIKVYEKDGRGKTETKQDASEQIEPASVTFPVEIKN